jgi:hypothetical protein
MYNSDIVDVVGSIIEKKIGGEWKHEVYILGCSSVHVNFVIDNREYVLRLYEVKDGHNFSEYVADHLPPMGGVNDADD